MDQPFRRTYSQITLDERRKIERWHAAKISVDIIAEKLGRHRSTIFRELKRNRFDDPEMRDLAGFTTVWSPIRGQRIGDLICASWCGCRNCARRSLSVSAMAGHPNRLPAA